MLKAYILSVYQVNLQEAPMQYTSDTPWSTDCLKKQRVGICELRHFTVHEGDCSMKNQVFWEMMPCRFSYNYGRFTGVLPPSLG
jgi:hypothetical protein